MSAVLSTKSYLLECLESLPISKRVFIKLGFDDVLELKEQILAILDQGAKKLGFDESPNLSDWLANLKAFELAKLKTNSVVTAPIIALPKEESGAMKALFQELFQSLFGLLGQRVDLLKLLFGAIDQWQRAYNQAHATSIRLGLDIRITVPEPNPFAKENDRHYLLLSKLLSTLEQYLIPKIEWQMLSAAQQFGGFLFFAITQSGITQIDKLNQLGYLALIRKKMDQPFSGFLFFSQRKQFGTTPYQSAILEGKSKNGSQPVYPIYRWLPDPITKRIYERYRKNWDSLQTDTRKYDAYIIEFLQALLKAIASPSKPGKRVRACSS